MRTPVSHIFRWVRRADGSRRMPERPHPPFDRPARRGIASGPGDLDLSAPTTLEMSDDPIRLEAFSLETFGEPDVFSLPTRCVAASTASEEDFAMRREIDLIGAGFRADE